MIQRDLLNCNNYNAEMLVFASQSLPFWHQKSIQKQCFLKTLSWTPFFEISCRFHSKIVDLGTPLESSGGQDAIQNLRNSAVVKTNWFLSAGGMFFHDLVLQISPGNPLAQFRPIWALISPPSWSISDSILLNFAFRWACFGKASPSKLGLVKMGRQNSSGDNNSYSYIYNLNTFIYSKFNYKQWAWVYISFI